MEADEDDLIPTSLRIIGACGSYQKVLVVVMLKIEVQEYVTR